MILDKKDIRQFLDEQQDLTTLRFITCGSVDDGKSTLIGRLLYESKNLFDDQLQALKSESRQYGTQGEELDLALLVDGLQAEREQGITIDVAYRFFATANRRYIVADTPGHEQYTRNMATGASTADVAIILVDARKGVLIQTRRHSRISSMLGIKHIVLAINKMDLVGYSKEVYQSIVADYNEFAKDLGFGFVTAIPVSGLTGDNVVATSQHMPWYQGPTLISYLDNVDVSTLELPSSFRLPVQWVNRPDMSFRGFAGTVVAGCVKKGDSVRILPSGVVTTVKDILSGFNSVPEAQSGHAVTLTLTDEVDVSRGDVIASAGACPEVADQFETNLLWLSDQEMIPGRQYLIKIHCKEVSATITNLKYQVDINSGSHLAVKTQKSNEITRVVLSTSAPIVFEPYDINHRMGAFILIDRLTFETVGAGMIAFALRRASNIHWQALDVKKAERAAHKHQQAKCIWFTGLSGSGKSTIASMLEKRLYAEGKHTYVLDGDNIRHGLNRDLGFTEADRVENIRRIAEVAKLMVDAGLIVLVSFISPYSNERRMARELFEDGEFFEVYVDTPLEICEQRDVKGLYAKARSGDLKNFTGLDSPYEEPESPEIRLTPAVDSVGDCVEQILRVLH